MKKILVSFATIFIGGAVVIILFLSLAKEGGPRYIYKGNIARKPLVIKPKEYLCSECNMQLEHLEYQAQITTKEGVTYFFDDIGCVVLWLQNNPLTDATIITQTLDTHNWIDATKAWYSKTANSPMGYGMAAHEHKKEGFISYEEMKLLMLQGKHLHDPFVKKTLLGEKISHSYY